MIIQMHTSNHVATSRLEITPKDFRKWIFCSPAWTHGPISSHREYTYDATTFEMAIYSLQEVNSLQVIVTLRNNNGMAWSSDQLFPLDMELEYLSYNRLMTVRVYTFVNDACGTLMDQRNNERL